MSEVNERTPEGTETSKHFCTTYLKQTSASMQWTITNFNLLQIGSNSIESSNFESTTEDVHTGTWKIKLYPNHVNEEKIGLFFSCSANIESIYVKYEACIIDAEGKDSNKKENAAQITSKDIGFSEFIARRDLVESLLPRGNLTIRCSVTVTCKNQTQFKRNDDGRLGRGCSLHQDLSKLLKEESLSDVVLLCDGRKFPVHKCVLSARSSVFSAMFTQDFKEKEENLIEIKGIESTIFASLLNYIYSDSIQVFTTVDTVIKLLAAADTYSLLELRGICEEHLKMNVSNLNLLEVAVAADLHSLDSLKEVCIKFMYDHGREVVFSDNSKDLYCVAPQFLLEGVLKQLFGGLSPPSQTVKCVPQFELPSQPQTSVAFGHPQPFSVAFGGKTFGFSSANSSASSGFVCANSSASSGFGSANSSASSGFGSACSSTLH